MSGPSKVVSCRGAEPGTRFHDVEVPVVAAIELPATLAHERDRAPVGRPGGPLLVVLSRGEDLGLTGCQIKEVEMIPAAVEIPGLVLLELEAVDDDRFRRGLGLVSVWWRRSRDRGR